MSCKDVSTGSGESWRYVSAGRRTDPLLGMESDGLPKQRRCVTYLSYVPPKLIRYTSFRNWRARIYRAGCTATFASRVTI